MPEIWERTLWDLCVHGIGYVIAGVTRLMFEIFCVRLQGNGPTFSDARETNLIVEDQLGLTRRVSNSISHLSTP